MLFSKFSAKMSLWNTPKSLKSALYMAESKISICVIEVDTFSTAVPDVYALLDIKSRASF